MNQSRINFRVTKSFYLNLFSVVIAVISLLKWTVTAEDITVMQDKSEVIFFDKDYFYDVTIKSYNVNDTHYAIANDMFIINDISNAMSKMKLLRKEGDDFSQEITNLEVSFCDMMLDKEWNPHVDLITDGVHGNFPKKCIGENTFPKGNYSTTDIVLDGKVILNGLPEGHYKVIIEENIEEKNILHYNIYFTVHKD